MRSILAYIRGLIADPIFLRVGMFLWGMPFLGVGGIALASRRPLEGYEWIGLALLSAVGCGGAFLTRVRSQVWLDGVSGYAQFFDLLSTIQGSPPM
jgi:hypothetical protein